MDKGWIDGRMDGWIDGHVNYGNQAQKRKQIRGPAFVWVRWRRPVREVGWWNIKTVELIGLSAWPRVGMRKKWEPRITPRFPPWLIKDHKRGTGSNLRSRLGEVRMGILHVVLNVLILSKTRDWCSIPKLISTKLIWKGLEFRKRVWGYTGDSLGH